MRYLHDELIPYFHTDENLVGILTSPTLMFRLPNFNLDINCMQIKFVIPGMPPAPAIYKIRNLRIHENVFSEEIPYYGINKSRKIRFLKIKYGHVNLCKMNVVTKQEFKEYKALAPKCLMVISEDDSTVRR